MSVDELTVRRAIFGKQVDNFLGSDIGKYLMMRAIDESKEALQAFRTCDPSDAVQVAELQRQINQAEKFQQWLEEAVSDGLQAMNVLDDRGEL